MIDWPKRLGPVAAVARPRLHEHGVGDVVPGPGVGDHVVEQVPLVVGAIEVKMGVDDQAPWIDRILTAHELAMPTRRKSRLLMPPPIIMSSLPTTLARATITDENCTIGTCTGFSTSQSEMCW